MLYEKLGLNLMSPKGCDNNSRGVSEANPRLAVHFSSCALEGRNMNTNAGFARKPNSNIYP